MKKKISLSDKIFVAGANGMAGSAICRNLYKKGYGDKNNDGIIFTPKRVELDLLDFDAVKRWFKENKPSVLIIASAKVGGIKANDSQPSTFLLENLKIQTNLLEVSKYYPVKRILFLGSSCIYPKLSKQPIMEEYLLTGSLETTNQWYAIAKIAGIKLCEALRIENNIDAISLMPTNLYGPGDNYHKSDSHVLAALIRKFYEAKKNEYKEVICWGSGEPLREFMYVDDLGEAVTFSLENWDPDSKNAPKDSFGNKLTFLNVGSGEEISIKELAQKISNIIGFKGEIKWDQTLPDGTPRKLLSINKIKDLGWSPKISLQTGIEKTIKNFIVEYENKTLRGF